MKILAFKITKNVNNHVEPYIELYLIFLKTSSLVLKIALNIPINFP